MVNIKLIVCLTRKILPFIFDTSNILGSKPHIFIILFHFELAFNPVRKSSEFSQMRSDGCPNILKISIGV
jgi:hypothetical protein